MQEAEVLSSVSAKLFGTFPSNIQLPFPGTLLFFALRMFLPPTYLGLVFMIGGIG